MYIFKDWISQKSIESIRKELIARGSSLAVAESVTGGLIQAAFTGLPDASKYFSGGITVYNLGQKVRQLDVESIHAESCDCISKQTAEEMAVSVRKKFFSTYGIAITGYATFNDRADNKSLYAFIAGANEKGILFSRKVVSKKEEGPASQMYFIEQIIQSLQEAIVK